MNKEVRKGITNQEVNKEFAPFIIVEILILSSLVTYYGATFFEFNIFATFIITLISTMIISFTPAYHVLGFFFSLGWGYIGYYLFHWLTTLFGGGKFIAVLLGIIGFIFIFIITVGARIGGKQYFDDIGN